MPTRKARAGFWLRVTAVNVYGFLDVSALLDLDPLGFLCLMGVVLFWPRTSTT